MKTQLVYVIVSDDEHIFLEQAYVSIWSAKYHNPDVSITVVLDDKTDSILIKKCYYADFMSLVNNKVVHKFDSTVSNMIRSRWLKTKCRELVKGDFLYLDVDTVISGSLQEIDNTAGSIGFVKDFNCDLKDNRSRFYYKEMLKKMFNVDMDLNGNYYNGGVYYSKDDSKSHNFFNDWYNGWDYCRSKNYFRDQLSLAKITQDWAKDINELDGSFNCQLSENLKYYNQAIILHYYRCCEHMHEYSVFFQKSFFLSISQNGLSNNDKKLIVSCKDQIYGPSNIVSGVDMMVYQSDYFRLAYLIYVKIPKLFDFLNFLSKGISKIIK